MLCSEPTGKSRGSNWLDRLRSTKGFPVGDDLDLDRFLSEKPNPSSSNPPNPNANPNPSSEWTRPSAEKQAAIPRRIGGRERELAGVVSNVLSELFFIGGSGENSALSGKKIPRKQTNPRICVATGSNDVGTGNSNSSVNADRKKTKRKNKKLKKKKKKKNKRRTDFAPKSSQPMKSDSHSLTQANREIVEDEGDEEEEQEDEEKELKGYSRSEVTVIDTSFAAWKTEKLVFRKKNVWKVREKKGKARSFGRKKRKSSDVEEATGFNSVERRTKVSAELPLNNNGNQSVKKPSADEVPNSNNYSREEDFRAGAANLNPMTISVDADSPDNSDHDFKRKSPFSSPLKKMRRVGSTSVVLIKGIQTDRKIAGKFSKN